MVWDRCKYRSDWYNLLISDLLSRTDGSSFNEYAIRLAKNIHNNSHTCFVPSYINKQYVCLSIKDTGVEVKPGLDEDD